MIETTSRTLRMSGIIADSAHSLILVQARVFVANNSFIALQLAIRGGEEELREHLANALLG